MATYEQQVAASPRLRKLHAETVESGDMAAFNAGEGPLHPELYDALVIAAGGVPLSTHCSSDSCML